MNPLLCALDYIYCTLHYHCIILIVDYIIIVLYLLYTTLSLYYTYCTLHYHCIINFIVHYIIIVLLILLYTTLSLYYTYCTPHYHCIILIVHYIIIVLYLLYTTFEGLRRRVVYPQIKCWKLCKKPQRYKPHVQYKQIVKNFKI